jgi:hypothetical protein
MPDESARYAVPTFVPDATSPIVPPPGVSQWKPLVELQREYYNRDSELILADTIRAIDAHPFPRDHEDYLQPDGTVRLGPNRILPGLSDEAYKTFEAQHDKLAHACETSSAGRKMKTTDTDINVINVVCTVLFVGPLAALGYFLLILWRFGQL